MSLEMDLDFFVMFSSMASIFGNVGQTSYSACNAFQDSLAQYRRQVLGLPGLAINWGPISGVGVMERDSGVAKFLTIAGLGFINAKDGVKYMVKVLTEKPSCFQITLCGVDWPRYIKSGLKTTSRMSVITAEINASDSQTNSSESLSQQIMLEKDAERREELLTEYVVLAINEWTGISSSSEIDLNKSLYSYGIDSASALTLKMQVESNLPVSFEVFYFMQPDTTALKLARDLAAMLSSDAQSEQLQNSEIQENGPVQTQAVLDVTPSAITSESHVQVVPLHTPSGATIKFFCVHPSHRYALNLLPISTGFQGQNLVSFYALGFTDPTTLSEDWGSVRELATHYVQLICKEQCTGPYFLGGYSYGGVVAYEMASLLTEQNQRVEFVAMIDTFPWVPRSRTVSSRLASMHMDKNFERRHVQSYFESFLTKMAVDSLKMEANEYKQLRENNTQDWVIDELQRRSFENGLATYNLRTLREALLRNHSISSRTHHEWQPPRVRYRGPLTFLKSQNARFSPRLPSTYSIEELWGQLVDGGTTVLFCPGDHFSLSELPNAHVTGSILATALAFNYRMLFPEFPRPARTFNQRRAVEKLSRGVNVFLHSKKGNKNPHFGELCFDEDTHKLELRSKIDEGETNDKEKTKKIIDLKDLRMVQPGRLVSSAQKYAWHKRRVGAHQSGNLGQVASVITRQRVYNLEFTDNADLKGFYNMIEAVFAVAMLTI